VKAAPAGGGKLIEPPPRPDPSNGAMQNTSLQHEIDEMFRQSQSFREAGQYTESMQALRTAVELINRYDDGPPHPPGEGGTWSGPGR
jgi:hypothetical protein